MAIFFQIFYFWWKLGPITVDAEDPLTLFNGRNSITFFGLESCTAFNSRKAVLATMSISARTCQGPCGHQVSPMDIGHVHWLITIIADLKKNQFFFLFHFLKFWYIFLKHFMFGGPPTIASAPKVWWQACQTWNALRVFWFWVVIDWFHLQKCNFLVLALSGSHTVEIIPSLC
jgi:hypothetical protein